MTVGVTYDPSSIIGSVGKNEVVGSTDDKCDGLLKEFWAFLIEFSVKGTGLLNTQSIILE